MFYATNGFYSTMNNYLMYGIKKEIVKNCWQECVSLKVKIRSLCFARKPYTYTRVTSSYTYMTCSTTESYIHSHFRNSSWGNPPPVWNRKRAQNLQLMLLYNGWSWKLNFILIAWICVKESTRDKRATKAVNRIKWCFNLRGLLVSSLILLHCPQNKAPVS